MTKPVMLKRILIFFCMLLALAGICLGQDPRGTILGRVTDASGAVVPNADVRATNAATGAVAEARTNESGNYRLPYLLAGFYRLTVELTGFKKHQQEGIEVRINDSLEINVQMTVGDMSESVEITAAAPLLDTSTSSLGQVLDGRRLKELPIQSGNP
jgi:hypothetical protein